MSNAGIRTRWVEHDSGGYWDYCDFPLKDLTVEQAEAWPMPDPNDFDYAAVGRRSEELAQFALVAGGAGSGDAAGAAGGSSGAGAANTPAAGRRPFEGPSSAPSSDWQHRDRRR